MTAFLAFLWGLRSAIMSSALFRHYAIKAPKHILALFGLLAFRYYAIRQFHEQKKSISFYQERIEWQRSLQIEIGENHGLS